MLITSDLSLTYHQNGLATTVLRDVSFSLQAGQVVGVVGPSGSGKSSLLYLLAGLKNPTAGAIAFRGLDYKTLSPQKLTALRREHFAFIFQSHFLVTYLTGIENVVAGEPGQGKEQYDRALSILRRLGVAEVARKFPHHMSVGQRQRVAIARALIKQADVIFADEPTASLNTQDAVLVMEALSEMRGRSAILLVTHDHRLLTYCDRVFELTEGRLEQKVAAAPRGGALASRSLLRRLQSRRALGAGWVTTGEKAVPN